jgi:hypothetical protein
MFSTALRTLSLLALPILAPVPGAGAVSPAVSATLDQCVAAAAQAGRSMTFSGQMETMSGAHRMAVQIVVQERTPGEVAFRTLGAPGLDVWQRSEVGLKIYKDVRQVTNLPAPASFRAVVHFRWLDEKGDVIRRATRRTPVCRQTGSTTTTAPTTTAPTTTAPATAPPAGQPG